MFTQGGPLQSSSEQAERLEAARFAGISSDTFLALPGIRFWAALLDSPVAQAEIIAHYRTQKRLEAVKNDMQARDIKRRRASRGKG